MSDFDSTPQICLDEFLTDIRPFRAAFDKGFEAYLIKHKGKPPASGVSLVEYCKWLNPKAKGPSNPSDMSVLISGHLHYFWQFSKAHFKFEHELSKHMVESDLPDSLPEQILQRLPYWSQWISLPVSVLSSDKSVRLDFDGAFVGYTRVNGIPQLCICAPFEPEDKTLRSNGFCPSITTHISLDGPVDPLDIVRHGHFLNLSEQPKEMMAELIYSLNHYLRRIIASIMFICSQQEQLYQEGHQQPKAKRLGKSYKLEAILTDRKIVVGKELVQVIKEFEEDVEKCTRAFNGRRPHIRKAHYHHFWTGPKDGPRKLICKWLPPSVVRGTLPE